MECAVVLEEVGGDFGVWLWHSLRDVLLWGRAAGRDRGHVFHPGAPAARAAVRPVLDPELEGVAEVLDGMVAEPARGVVEEVAAACREVAGWSERSGWVGTALAWMEAAAFLMPEDPGSATEAARLAVRRAEYARAEAWVRRSVALAQVARDWRWYALSFLYVSRAAAARGNQETAMRLLRRAYRASVRWGVRDVLATVKHELHLAEAAPGGGGEAAAGVIEAREFHRLYEQVGWLVERGEYRRAIGPMWAIHPAIGCEGEGAAACAVLARAAALLGDAGVAEQAWAVAHGWASGRELGDPQAARVMLDLAHAALALGAMARAEECSDAAAQRAARADDLRLAMEVEEVRARIARRGGAEADGAETRVVGPLVKAFVRALDRVAERRAAAALEAGSVSRNGKGEA
ncbi:MAG: hypothetical protein AB1941_28955 [Gemmatimonadota bacterium]